MYLMEQLVYRGFLNAFNVHHILKQLKKDPLNFFYLLSGFLFRDVWLARTLSSVCGGKDSDVCCPMCALRMRVEGYWLLREHVPVMLLFRLLPRAGWLIYAFFSPSKMVYVSKHTLLVYTLLQLRTQSNSSNAIFSHSLSVDPSSQH